MIVVDTNIIAYLTIAGEYSQAVEEILVKDSEWVVPYLWRHEFRNVLVAYLRARRIAMPDAIYAMERADLLLLEKQFEVETARVLELALLSKCSSYDCEFVALAEQRRVSLVTADAPLQKAFPKIALSIEDFLKSK